MQRLEVSGAVRLIYKSLGVKGLKTDIINLLCTLKAAVGVDDCKDRSCVVVERRVVNHGYIILPV